MATARRDLWAYSLSRKTLFRLLGHLLLIAMFAPSVTALNAAPHLASSGLSWSITGLTQGGAYYCVVTAVDYQGNESAPSAEVSFVPDP